VQEVRRLTKIAVVAIVLGAIGAVVARLRRPVETPPGPGDERTEELRQKLAEARAAAADQDDFEAAGMGAETIVEEAPPAEPAQPEKPAAAPEPAPPPPKALEKVEKKPEKVETKLEKAEPKPEKAPAKEPAPPAASAGPPPQDEFEAMRRRIHEEGKAAADEMRRSADSPESS
jgi:hypothetical protein